MGILREQPTPEGLLQGVYDAAPEGSLVRKALECTIGNNAVQLTAKTLLVLMGAVAQKYDDLADDDEKDEGTVVSVVNHYKTRYALANWWVLMHTRSETSPSRKQPNTSLSHEKSSMSLPRDIIYRIA